MTELSDTSTTKQPEKARKQKWSQEDCINAIKTFIMDTGYTSISRYYLYKMGDGDGNPNIPASGTIVRMLGKWPIIAEMKDMFGEEFCSEYIKANKVKKNKAVS